MFIKPSHTLGVGINYRNEIADDIIKNINSFDFIEINTERFFHNVNETLNTIISQRPVVLHGLTLSLGTVAQDISQSYLDNLRNTLRDVNCEWYSEHIAATKVKDIEIRALMPVSFNKETAKSIAVKVKEIMSLSNKPFLLENISYYYTMPGSRMTESEFISTVVDDADCGILLDLNNLYVNSVNHGYDPFKFINNIPLERVVEVHLAGCDYIKNMLVDTHASSIKTPVLNLLNYLCKKTKINGVIIERDDRLDNFEELINEVALVKSILLNR